jgi:hypothetical protein
LNSQIGKPFANGFPIVSFEVFLLHRYSIWFLAMDGTISIFLIYKLDREYDDMKIMVCASIGYGGIDYIREMHLFLRKEGFDIIDHIMNKGMDYSDINDFRDNKDLSHRIVTNDLEFIHKTDVLVVLANKPSYGAGIEMFIAKNSGKQVILFAKAPVPTPWPITFSDDIVKSEQELIKSLRELEQIR